MIRGTGDRAVELRGAVCVRAHRPALYVHWTGDLLEGARLYSKYFELEQMILTQEKPSAAGGDLIQRIVIYGQMACDVGFENEACRRSRGTCEEQLARAIDLPRVDFVSCDTTMRHV